MNQEIIASRIDAFAMATGVLAGVVAAGAALTTPTGLTAVGIWLGLIEEPWIVRIAPYFDMLATASGAISGCSFFVVQCRKRKRSCNKSTNTNNQQAR